MRYVIIILVIFFISLASCSISEQHLQKFAQIPPYAFKSDGCSCWPDYEWVDCCVEHDAIYWMGGSREERKKADIALRKCVSQKGYPIIGKIMYYGVRVGGVYWFPTPFRWGFGWSYPQSGPPNKQY